LIDVLVFLFALLSFRTTPFFHSKFEIVNSQQKKQQKQKKKGEKKKDEKDFVIGLQQDQKQSFTNAPASTGAIFSCRVSNIIQSLTYLVPWWQTDCSSHVTDPSRTPGLRKTVPGDTSLCERSFTWHSHSQQEELDCVSHPYTNEQSPLLQTTEPINTTMKKERTELRRRHISGAINM